MTVVRPSLRCSSRISTRTSSRSLASRLESGSSSSSTSGRITSARASATRCCWPPDSWRGRRSREALEPHEPQGLVDARGDLGLRQLAHLEAEGDVLGDRHVREQRVALEHHAGIAPPRRQVRDVAPAEADRAAGRLDEAGDHAQRRRLAAAGGAEQHHELAVRDIESDVAHGADVAVALGEAIELEAAPSTQTHLR